MIMLTQRMAGLHRLAYTQQTYRIDWSGSWRTQTSVRWTKEAQADFGQVNLSSAPAHLHCGVRMRFLLYDEEVVAGPGAGPCQR